MRENTTPKHHVLCLGDSLTYGTGSTPGNAYPDVLLRLLQADHADALVRGDGKPGASTRDFRDALRMSAGSADAARWYGGPFGTVVILLGCNDCRRDNWVEAPESIASLDEITEMCLPLVHARRERIFLCTTLPLADPMPRDIIGGQHPWQQDKVEKEINPGMAALCQRKGLGFIDLHGAFARGLAQDSTLYDGLHPFDSGYALIARTIHRAITLG